MPTRRFFFSAIAVIASLACGMSAAAQNPLLGSQCSLVYIGEPEGSLYEGLRALLGSEGLAEMRLGFRQFRPGSAEANNVDLRQGSLWALRVPDKDRKLYSLLQGAKLPSVVDIQTALDGVGIKSPIAVQRGFVKQYPGNLEARLTLLNMLREHAEARTLQILDIKPNDVQNAIEVFRITTSSSVVFGTSALGDKKLDPEQDAKIWGEYAQELQTMFSSGNWRLVELHPTFLVRTREPNLAEACSPTMVQLYTRLIPLIEAHLEQYPSHADQWNTYGWAVSIAKTGTTKALFDRIAPSPDIHWPTPEALSILIFEGRTKENGMAAIAETLWASWPKCLASLAAHDFGADGSDFVRGASTGLLESAWHDDIAPLLESLIKANRVHDAETIILDTIGAIKYGAFRDVQSRAAGLALALGRQDLQAKWLALQAPVKDKLGENDLYIALRQQNAPLTQLLVIVNADETAAQPIDPMLRQGQMNEWRLARAQLNQELSEFLRQREAWPEGETHWALFDSNKMVGDGPGLPTEGALLQCLETSRIQTPSNILRGFIYEHPSHIGAKDDLLRELKRIAEQKTKEMLSADAGINLANMLPEKDDEQIWGEYASLYRQILPCVVDECRFVSLSMWRGGSIISDYFIHSQTMKNLANFMLPQIEAAIMRQPTDHFLWGAWASLPGPHIRETKKLVDALPLNRPLDMPPFGVRVWLLGLYADRSDWRGIIGLQEWRMEAMRYSPGLVRSVWLNDMRHLLEAYLRLEGDRDANELIHVWSMSPEWQQIKQSAVELAEKCGENALAEQWGKL
jgi:hypothetical protein